MYIIFRITNTNVIDECVRKASAFDLFRHTASRRFPPISHSRIKSQVPKRIPKWRLAMLDNRCLGGLAEKFHVCYNRILRSVNFKGYKNGQYLTRFISFIYVQKSNVLSGGELVPWVAFTQNDRPK